MDTQEFKRSRDQLHNAIKDLVTSINLLHQNGLLLPAMMMCYATIDILAALARPQNKEESDGKDFRDWVERYLLPDSKLPCSATDLWAARCGLLHTYTPNARDVRKGKALKLLYIEGRVDESMRASMQFVHGDYIAIVTQDLYNAITFSLNQFMEELKVDESLARRVTMRANEFLVNASMT